MKAIKVLILACSSVVAANLSWGQAQFYDFYLAPNPVPASSNGFSDTWVQNLNYTWQYLMPVVWLEDDDLGFSMASFLTEVGWVSANDIKRSDRIYISRPGGMQYLTELELWAHTDNEYSQYYLADHYVWGWWEWKGDSALDIIELKTLDEHHLNLGWQWGYGNEPATLYIRQRNPSSNDYIYRPWINVHIYSDFTKSYTHNYQHREGSYYIGEERTIHQIVSERIYPGWNWIQTYEAGVSSPDYHEEWIYFYPPIVGSVTATSSSNHAGHRSSDTVLRLVHDGSPREAVVSAAVSNYGVHHPYPKWHGPGVAWADGSTQTTWSGTATTNVTCEVWPGSTGSVLIETIHNGRINRSINLGNVQNIIGLLNDALASKFQQSGITMSVGVEGTKEYVDYYNDGSRIGLKHSLAGEIDITLPAVTFVQADVPCPAFPLAGATFQVSTNGFMTAGYGTIVHDESKQNPTTVEGGVNAATTLTATIGAYVGICYLVNVSIVGSGNTTISAGFDVLHNGDVVYGKGAIEVGNVNVSVSGYFEVGEGQGIGCTAMASFWEHEIPCEVVFETPNYELYRFD